MAEESNFRRAVNLMNEASDQIREEWTPHELALIASIVLYLEDKHGIEFDGIDGLANNMEDWLNE